MENTNNTIAQYLVTDRNNKDRENPIVDSFATRAEAEAFAAQLSIDNDGEEFAIEEVVEEEDSISNLAESLWNGAETEEHLEGGDALNHWMIHGTGRVVFEDAGVTAFFVKHFREDGEVDCYCQPEGGEWAQA